MLQYIFKRLLEAIPVLWIIATLTFFMLHIAPGGPFDQEKALTPEIEASLKAFYGLDKPVLTQYTQYLKNLAQGDLGPSFKYPGWSVNEIIADKVPVSLELGLYALAFALILGITVGVIASIRPNTWLDGVPMSFALIGICLPSFVIGPVLILLFSLKLDWFNASGWHFATDRILPTITLGLFYAAYIARLTRGGMIDALQQDYIRTARAKGVPPWRVAMIHALRNGIAPVISYLGPALAGLISGSFVIETIFHIPGLGHFFIMAAFNRDYTLVLGTVLCYASFIVISNLISDIILVWLNPRQTFE